jgi:hypothetical protein
MTAKIIQLDNFRVGYRHWANGIQFPQLYRVTGYGYTVLNEGRQDERLVQSTETEPPSYSLSPDGVFGLASATAEPIRSLDPIKDRGCIIVRHHLSEAAAVGYIACVMDMPRTELHETGQMLWQTREGMFTLLRRPSGKGRPDNLVVYITSKPIESGPLSGEMDIVHHIVFPDGSNTRDADVLLDEDDPNRS